MLDLPNIADTLRPVVEDQLGGLAVDSVKVTEEVGHDGDRYLRVEIVFERGEVGGSQVLSLRRRMRDRLSEIGEDRFPLTTFMTRREAEEAGATG